MAQFTVNSEGKKVVFSPGNLYWDGSKFAFEEHQYDFPTAWDANHIGHFFWSKDADVARAESYDDPSAADTDTFFAADGGAIEGYTVLSMLEWEYLIEHYLAKNSKNSNAFRIAGTDCVILQPTGSIGVVADSYTAEEWARAESYDGLVAIPFARLRVDSSIYEEGEAFAEVWSSSSRNRDDAISCYFDVDSSSVNAQSRSRGFSVRLVRVQPSLPEKFISLKNLSRVLDYLFLAFQEVYREIRGKLNKPSGGTAGQVLTKTEDGGEWQNVHFEELENRPTVDSVEMDGETDFYILTATEIQTVWDSIE